jgi:FkbM family methyltransferase
MVYAFEPLALNMNTLRRIKSKFGLTNIHEFQVAVGEQNGIIEMVMPGVNHVPIHGLSHGGGIEKNGNDSGLKSAVQMIYLDEFDVLLNSGKRVTAIKIDIENFEYYALKGAQKIIAAHRPVIYCELWDNEYRGKSIGLLNNLGYSAFVMQGKELVRIEKAAVEKHNFFFLPNSLTD